MATADCLLTSRDAMTEIFEDVRLLIFDTIHKFRRMYPMVSFDDLRSEAYAAFMVAYDCHDNRSSFPTYVRWVVHKGLLEYVRKETKRSLRFSAVEDMEQAAGEYLISLFDVPDFLRECSRDAQVVALLALDPPREIVLLRELRGGAVNNFRSAIRTYLRDIGWSAQRITSAFADVRKVMTT